MRPTVLRPSGCSSHGETYETLNVDARARDGSWSMVSARTDAVALHARAPAIPLGLDVCWMTALKKSHQLMKSKPTRCEDRCRALLATWR